MFKPNVIQEPESSYPSRKSKDASSFRSWRLDRPEWTSALVAPRAFRRAAPKTGLAGSRRQLLPRLGSDRGLDARIENLHGTALLRRDQCVSSRDVAGPLCPVVPEPLPSRLDANGQIPRVRLDVAKRPPFTDRE